MAIDYLLVLLAAAGFFFQLTVIGPHLMELLEACVTVVEPSPPLPSRWPVCNTGVTVELRPGGLKPGCRRM